MSLLRGLRRRVAVEDFMESASSYQHIIWRSGLGKLPQFIDGLLDQSCYQPAASYQ